MLRHELQEWPIFLRASEKKLSRSSLGVKKNLVSNSPKLLEESTKSSSKKRNPFRHRRPPYLAWLQRLCLLYNNHYDVLRLAAVYQLDSPF